MKYTRIYHIIKLKVKTHNSKVSEKEENDKINRNISKKDKISDDNDNMSKTLKICKNVYCDIFTKKGYV